MENSQNDFLAASNFEATVQVSEQFFYCKNNKTRNFCQAAFRFEANNSATLENLSNILLTLSAFYKLTGAWHRNDFEYFNPKLTQERFMTNKYYGNVMRVFCSLQVNLGSSNLIYKFFFRSVHFCSWRLCWFGNFPLDNREFMNEKCELPTSFN